MTAPADLQPWHFAACALVPVAAACAHSVWRAFVDAARDQAAANVASYEAALNERRGRRG